VFHAFSILISAAFVAPSEVQDGSLLDQTVVRTAPIPVAGIPFRYTVWETESDNRGGWRWMGYPRARAQSIEGACSYCNDKYDSTWTQAYCGDRPGQNYFCICPINHDPSNGASSEDIPLCKDLRTGCPSNVVTRMALNPTCTSAVPVCPRPKLFARFCRR